MKNLWKTLCIMLFGSCVMSCNSANSDNSLSVDKFNEVIGAGTSVRRKILRQCFNY